MYMHLRAVGKARHRVKIALMTVCSRMKVQQMFLAAHLWLAVSTAY